MLECGLGGEALGPLGQRGHAAEPGCPGPEGLRLGPIPGTRPWLSHSGGLARPRSRVRWPGPEPPGALPGVASEARVRGSSRQPAGNRPPVRSRLGRPCEQPEGGNQREEGNGQRETSWANFKAQTTLFLKVPACLHQQRRTWEWRGVLTPQVPHRHFAAALPKHRRSVAYSRNACCRDASSCLAWVGMVRTDGFAQKLA